MNKNMRKRWYILLLLLVVSSSCKDEWDNFYGEGEDDDRAAAAKITLWAAIEQEPNYSKFKLLLEKTGLAKELDKGRILTVWLPSDNYITEDIIAMDSNDMRRFVLNHLNPLALYRTKLVDKNGLKLETLAKKYVSIAVGRDHISVDKINVSKFDLVYTNGVIHEIAGLLTPTKNVMEYLLESGEEYSVFRDSLLAYNDTVFNLEDSYPIGVNEVGQTIYDSVFDITNELTGNLDFANEEGSVTLFLPSNEDIDEMLEDLHTYFENLGLVMENKDTLACFEFLMRATFLRGEMTNTTGTKYIHTYGGKSLRLDVQILSTAYEECSNGIVYEFEQVRMPRDVFMKPVEYVIPTLFEVHDSVRHTYYELRNLDDPLAKGVLNSNETNDSQNVTDNVFADNNNKSWKFLSVKADKEQYIDLTLLERDLELNIKPAKLMPGKYLMEGKGYSYTAANVKIYLNLNPLEYNDSKMEHVDIKPWNGELLFPMGERMKAFGYEGDAYKVMSDTIEVGFNKGNDIIRIESSGAGSLSNCIRIRALKFTPVGDNYYY